MALNRIFGVLIFSNLIFIVTLSLFNSVIGKWGFYLYLPGLFLIPHYQLLGLNRSLPALFLSGLTFDHFFNHTLGFHAFAMCLIFLIAREFLHLGKQSSVQITIFQLIANLIMAILWAIFPLEGCPPSREGFLLHVKTRCRLDLLGDSSCH